jgi:hypothetical protein
MVRRLDETIIGFGEGRIAKNTGVVSRIDSVQAARDHARLAATVAIRPSRRRSGAENAQGGDCNRDESQLSTHGGFLLLPDVARCESMARLLTGKGRLRSIWAHDDNRRACRLGRLDEGLPPGPSGVEVRPALHIGWVSRIGAEGQAFILFALPLRPHLLHPLLSRREAWTL